MTTRPYNVLFLCTGNSARSVMAEVLLDSMGAGRFKAYSAGSHPTGRVHPFTLEQLQRSGYGVDGLRSKSWDEFARAGAPEMDIIITVCDSAAGEVCPVWPGRPVTAHWGFEDPAAFVGPDEEQRAKFAEVWRQIGSRVRALASLPEAKLGRLALQQRVRDIAKQ